MKPTDDSVIRRNLEIRGITNSAEQDMLIEAGKQFHLPPEIEHQVVEITGDTHDDKVRLISVAQSLLTLDTR